MEINCPVNLQTKIDVEGGRRESKETISNKSEVGADESKVRIF